MEIHPVGQFNRVEPSQDVSGSLGIGNAAAEMCMALALWEPAFW